jgi:hypothetical protein
MEWLASPTPVAPDSTKLGRYSERDTVSPDRYFEVVSATQPRNNRRVCRCKTVQLDYCGTVAGSSRNSVEWAEGKNYRGW